MSDDYNIFELTSPRSCGDDSEVSGSFRNFGGEESCVPEYVGPFCKLEPRDPQDSSDAQVYNSSGNPINDTGG